MGDILYTQQIQIVASKNATPITEKDFEINPAEIFTTSLLNESFSGRYTLADLSVDEVPGMGSIALGKLFVITPASNIQVKFTNSLGTSPALTFLGGKTSVVHIEFTGFSLTNTSGAPVKGRYLVIGD